MKKLLLIILALTVQNLEAQIKGCTDPLAKNYNAAATLNDGSCMYDTVTVSPVKSWDLPQNLIETSGLISWNNQLWTHNDDTDINLYAFDTNTVRHPQAYPLKGIKNIDWEEITQDSSYIYIGDFGNNYKGNRSDLKIFRIAKRSILLKKPVIDIIRFNYQLQVSLEASPANKTNFDCEAFIIGKDSIYLFTKEWSTFKTSVYTLSKQPGKHTAIYQSGFDIQGLVTGATYLPSKNLIVLCGYLGASQPNSFLYLLYDFKDNKFFGGNKRKILLDLIYHQTEGICTKDGLQYYVSNELFKRSIFTNPQKLHLIDLSGYLKPYVRK